MAKAGLLVGPISSTPDGQIITGTNVPNAAFGRSLVALDCDLASRASSMTAYVGGTAAVLVIAGAGP